MKKKTELEFDINLLLVIFAVLGFGLIMVFNTSALNDYRNYKNITHKLFRQFTYISISCFFAWLLYIIDLQLLRKYTSKILLLNFILLILVWVPVIGVKVNGAHRWINLHFFRFQPSELLKLSLILFIANYLDIRKINIKNFKYGFLPPLIIVSIFLFLVILEPDFSSTALLGTLVLLMFFLGGARISHILILILIGVLMASIFILSSPYRLERIKDYFKPVKLKTRSWQKIQSKVAIIEGGFAGKGLGNSEQKLGLLPESNTDYIFSIIAEELGFFGLTFFFGIYLYMFYRLIRIVVKTKNYYKKNLAAGITIMLILQFLINIGVATGVVPSTGVTFPFISYGGSSIIIFISFMGIMLNISANE